MQAATYLLMASKTVVSETVLRSVSDYRQFRRLFQFFSQMSKVKSFGNMFWKGRRTSDDIMLSRNQLDSQNFLTWSTPKWLKTKGTLPLRCNVERGFYITTFSFGWSKAIGTIWPSSALRIYTDSDRLDTGYHRLLPASVSSDVLHNRDYNRLNILYNDRDEILRNSLVFLWVT